MPEPHWVCDRWKSQLCCLVPIFDDIQRKSVVRRSIQMIEGDCSVGLIVPRSPVLSSEENLGDLVWIVLQVICSECFIAKEKIVRIDIVTNNVVACREYRYEELVDWIVVVRETDSNITTRHRKYPYKLLQLPYNQDGSSGHECVRCCPRQKSAA